MCGSNTKITKFDLFNLSQTVINIAILVTRVLLLVTPPGGLPVLFSIFLFWRALNIRAIIIFIDFFLKEKMTKIMHFWGKLLTLNIYYKFLCKPTLNF